jgi:hypothetical protein
LSTEVRALLLDRDVTFEKLSVDPIIVCKEHDITGPIAVDVISLPDSEPGVFKPPPATMTMERGK